MIALFLFVFLVLGTALTRATEAFGQNHGAPPQCGHTISNSPPNPTTTPDPLCAHASGAVFSEDPKMAEVTIYVSTQEELYEALQNATGGETILLAPGDYGELKLGDYTNYPGDFGSEVTIRSEEPEAPATFSGMDLRGVANLSFDDVTFDYSYKSGDPSFIAPFQILNCTEISISNSIFDGDIASGTGTAADGFGYGKGLVVLESSGIDIIGNEFFDWLRAAIFSNSSSLSVVENNIHDIRSDGLDFAQVTSVLIEGNYLHNFVTSPSSDDHADFIQFWTSSTTQPSSDIIIRSNVLDVGDGGTVQSIFMRNEAVEVWGAGLPMYYKNILIEENVILGNHNHGITVGETDGLTINNNSVLASEDASLVPAIFVSPSSINVSVAYNATSAINGYKGQGDWTFLGNAVVQNTDPMAPGYYGDQFIESSFFQPNGVAGYLVAPGSMLDQLGAGATLLYSASTSESVFAAFDIGSASDGSGDLILDGRYSMGIAGGALPEGTTYFWKLESGALFEGPVLTHHFAEPGFHHVELIVTLPDGSTSIASAEIAVSGNDLLSYDSSSGLFVVSGYGTSSALALSGSGSVSIAADDYAIDLGAAGTQVSISRQQIERIFGSEYFSISFSLKADTLGTSGELFRLHSSFLAEVTSTGELKFSITNADGVTYSLLTTGAHLNNGSQHEIAILIDDVENTLGITIDGTLLAQKTVTDSVLKMGYWDLSFGNPWGAKNFDGRINDFDIDVVNSDYPAFLGSLDATATPIQSAETPTAVDPLQTDVSDEATYLVLPELDGFKMDLLALANDSQGKLIGDAQVQNLNGSLALSLDGSGDFARLGELSEIETSSKITLDIEFSRDDPIGRNESLVLNNSKLSVIIKGDSLEVQLGTSYTSKSEAFLLANDVGIGNTDLHELRIVADSYIDRVQVILDGEIVIDRSDIAFDFTREVKGNGWWNSGWSVGEGGRRLDDFSGHVTEFQIDDSALFIVV